MDAIVDGERYAVVRGEYSPCIDCAFRSEDMRVQCTYPDGCPLKDGFVFVKRAAEG